ncbi:MAG TPA: DUF1328 domain-containing protein [Dongiaceae bacterium]|nr:DUF1328 domain-containing protein [Dongiaceae bacterium]
MLYYALVFLIVAIIAAALGFSGIAGSATLIAKVLFVAALIAMCISLMVGRRPPPL